MANDAEAWRVPRSCRAGPPGDGRSRSRQLARQPRRTPMRRQAADVAGTRGGQWPVEAPDLPVLDGREIHARNRQPESSL